MRQNIPTSIRAALSLSATISQYFIRNGLTMRLYRPVVVIQVRSGADKLREACTH